MRENMRSLVPLVVVLPGFAGPILAEEVEPTGKSGFEQTSQIGGPSSVTAQLQEDDEVKWNLLGRDSDNPGTLVFSVDNRHRLGTAIAPASLGFEVGYLGIPGTLFSDIDTVLVDLHWQQVLNGGRTGLVLGRYDPNDTSGTFTLRDGTPTIVTMRR
jgi:hypothetical protein